MHAFITMFIEGHYKLANSPFLMSKHIAWNNLELTWLNETNLNKPINSYYLPPNV